MSKCFLKLGQLFYSKDEKEMYLQCEIKLKENQKTVDEAMSKFEEMPVWVRRAVRGVPQTLSSPSLL